LFDLESTVRFCIFLHFHLELCLQK